MAETKGYGIDVTDKPLTDTPPPYSSGAQTSRAPEPITQAPTMGVPMGVMHAPVGMVGTHIGVVGANVGVVGVNVGHGTTMVPVMMAQQMSPRPVAITCKSCNMNITTRVDKKATWKTHFFAGLICLMGCFCGCCLIPYHIDSCLNGDHYCPNCEAYIGTYTTYA